MHGKISPGAPWCGWWRLLPNGRWRQLDGLWLTRREALQAALEYVSSLPPGSVLVHACAAGVDPATGLRRYQNPRSESRGGPRSIHTIRHPPIRRVCL
jgi:hypothetical protein